MALEKPPSSQMDLKKAIVKQLVEAEEEAEANRRVASDLYLELPSSVNLENERMRSWIESTYGKLRITWREESQLLVVKARPSRTHERAVRQFVRMFFRALGPNEMYVSDDGSESESYSNPDFEPIFDRRTLQLWSS